MRLVVPILALLAAAGPALGQPPPPVDVAQAARHTEVVTLNQEVTAISERLSQIERKEAELAKYAATLAARVRSLKKASGGIMRDAQLKDTLKEARQVLATLRNLADVRRILNTTLRTRQVALVRKADTEADRLLERGETAVLAGDDAAAGVHFEAAIDLLMMAGSARVRETPKPPALLPEPGVEFVLSGQETPDDFRGLALVQRDVADRLRWNLSLLSRELARLQRERDTLGDLLALKPPGSASGARSLTDLNARIGRAQDEIDRLRRRMAMFLARAAILERQAGLEEAALMQEAVALARTAP